jgi:hypothetical protein
MADRIEELIAALMALPDAERQRIARQIAQGAIGVADGGYTYGPTETREMAGVKPIVVLLPDELAKQAQAAGLLGDKRIEELIRRALQAEPRPALAGERRLIRHNGRLIVDSLPGEEAVTDEHVRDALDKMDW